jgi:hypothetical protein
VCTNIVRIEDCQLALELHSLALFSDPNVQGVGISTEGLASPCEECVIVVYLIADTAVSIPDKLEVVASDDRSIKRVRVRIEVQGRLSPE